MEELQTKLRKILEKRRLRSSYKRRQLEVEVEFLLKRHRSYEKTKQCLVKIPGLPYFTTDNKAVFAKMLRETFRGCRYFMNRSYVDGMTDNTMKDIWARHPGNLEDLQLIALKSTMRLLNILLIIQDENNRVRFSNHCFKLSNSSHVYLIIKKQ